MTFRYIGSKARMTDALREAVSERLSANSRFVDGFAGTGAVAASVAQLGIPVVVNDTLHSAVTMSLARMVAGHQAAFHRFGGYDAVIAAINAVSPIEGYLYWQYSPASLAAHGLERRYFTERNAAKLDAMRSQIARWSDGGLISDLEETLLLGDLISAVNRAANIAGTYGCFLSSWQKSALEPVVIKARALNECAVEMTGVVGDVHDLNVRPDDIVYFDPPYTKRQYASYYHILETVVLHDSPVVEGVSGLRPWREKASVFCYKRKALAALVDLITKTKSRTVLLSYSCEGHVDLDDLTGLLGVSGEVSVQAIDRIGRYRPNVTASSNGDAVTEYMVSYTREVANVARHRKQDRMLQKETA